MDGGILKQPANESEYIHQELRSHSLELNSNYKYMHIQYNTIHVWDTDMRANWEMCHYTSHVNLLY